MAEVMTQKKSNRPSDFLEALALMKKECGMDNLKLSDWGMKPEDLPEMVTNARDIAGGFYRFDVRPLTDDEVLEIYKKSYK